MVASQPGAPLAPAGTAARHSDAALAAALQGGGLTLVSCRPLTGRTHQVRGQAAGRAGWRCWQLLCVEMRVGLPVLPACACLG